MLQSLIKKHFPAPGNKLEELFGFDSGTNGRSSSSSQQLTPVKRKKKRLVDREIDQKILTVDVAFFASFGMNSGVVKERCT